MLEYIQIYPETLEMIGHYTESERCRLIESMARYAFHGEAPDWQESAPEWYIWPALRQAVDRASKRAEQNRANASGSRRNEATSSETKRTKTKRSKRGYTDTDTDTDIYDDDNARARENPFTIDPATVDPLIVKVQQELNGLTDRHYGELEDYRQALSDDVVSFAIDTAVAHGARNWAYVAKVLREYTRAGIKTVGEAKALDEQHEKTRPRGKVVGAQLYNQRPYDNAELEKVLGVDDLFK